MDCLKSTLAPSAPHRRFYDSFSLALVAGCFVFSFWRALTRSVTHDEALTMFFFVSKGFKAIFDPGVYDTNNHVLHTLLCTLSTGLLGSTHLGMRLPALVGCLVYLAAAFLACRQIVRPMFAVAALGLLSLNPIIFDFFSQARGYSLALGFFMLANFEFMRLLAWASRSRSAGEEARAACDPARVNRHIVFASILLGLSVATHPYFAFACSAVSGAFLILAPIAANRHRRHCEFAVFRLFFLACLPGAVIVWLTYSRLRPAMRTGRWNGTGAATLWNSAREIIEYSLGLNGIDQGLRVPRPEMQSPTWILILLIVTLVMGAALITAWRFMKMLRSARPARMVSDLALCHAGATFMILLLLHIFAARVWGTSYPVARLGMPQIVCLILWLAFAAAHPVFRHFAKGRIPRVLGALASLLLVWQANLVRPQAYYTYEADALQIADRLHKLADRIGEPLSVDADWILAPSLDFYRKTLDMQTVEIRSNGMRSVSRNSDIVIAPCEKPIKLAGLRPFYCASSSGVCLALGRVDYYHEESLAD